MIIIEGFDCAGKTTLAHALSNMLNVPMHQLGGPTRDEADVEACLIKCLTRMRQRCVQDRVTHISESVYSMLTNPKKAVIALNSIREVTHAELIIYCRPPTEFLLSELTKHQMKEGDTLEHCQTIVDGAPTLIRLYDSMMTMASYYAGPRVITYDRSKDGDLDHIKAIVRRKFG